MFVDTSKGPKAQAMADIVAQGLPVAMLVFPFVGFQIVAGGFFQYIGRAPLAMLLSTTRQLLFLLPLLLTLTPKYGAMGAWMSMPLADGAAVLVAGTLLFVQIRKFKRLEREQLFGRNA